MHLPEREQVHTSFDMLYMLAKKMEVQQPLHSHFHLLGKHVQRVKAGGSSDTYRDKYLRYPAPTGQIVMLEEEELLPPDPESPDSEASEGVSHSISQSI